MIMNMSMSSYEFENPSLEAEYDEDVMNAGWNPDVDFLCEKQLVIEDDWQTSNPVLLSALDSLDDCF